MLSPTGKAPRLTALALVGFALCWLWAGAGATGSAAQGSGEPPPFEILVFHKTAGFRHASIQDGITALGALGQENGFSIVATQDDAYFTSDSLSRFRAVVFLSTTGDILDESGQLALEQYIREGGGFVGIHAAADTEYGWAWYGGLVGAYFESHPPGTASATIKVLDKVHPGSSGLPSQWVRTDEWYNYQTNPRDSVHVLMTLDESTFAGGTMGSDHPISWCRAYAGGRSFYTGGGHTSASFSEPLFRAHLVGGILYAAGIAEGDCGASLSANFEKVVLDSGTQNPMALEVAPDGRVFFVERDGRLQVFDPVSGTTGTAGTLDVVTTNEDGLIGIALDPDFESTHWIYLFYSPAGSNPVQHVSRFEMVGDQLDMGSEQILLVIPVQRDQCCHSGGELEFDADGNLFIATGDNTNPFESSGYAPIDERPGRSAWDAQGTSANAADLRGKILRIRPTAVGSYDIPDGNLFAPDGSEGRPEIYVMGVRNPFRIEVDRDTGILYWGDVGPDAGGDSDARGPRGLDEWNQARAAGNYGWPYCIGPNQPYRDFDFASGVSGSYFDCEAPANNSPNNSGPLALPAAEPAWIWYPYGSSSTFPQIPAGPGRTAMAGPIYRYEETSDSGIRFPQYFDRSLILYEWSRSRILNARLDEGQDLLELIPLFDELAFNRPISMKFGPDGALYVLEWGSGFGGDNEDSQLARIEYRPNGGSPIVVASADVYSGPAPLTVQFSAAGTFDPDPGDVLSYAWDFEGDGVTDATAADASHTYDSVGVYTAILRVDDSTGNTGTASLVITVGNTRPTVRIDSPTPGGFYAWGDSVAYNVTVVDAEDGQTDLGTIDCARVVLQLFVGHDDHSHPLSQSNGCSGRIQTAPGHGASGDNVFHVLEASYTDLGGAGGVALTGRDQVVIRPKRVEAEHFSENSGTAVESTGDVLGGGENVGFIEDGDYLVYADLDLQNTSFVTFRVASAGPGGVLELRNGSPAGPIIARAVVEPTGAWQTYRDISAPVNAPAGLVDVFAVFRATTGTTGLFNINWFEFVGRGIATRSDQDGKGLFGQYFTDENFGGRSVNTVDARINFNWGTDAPSLTIPSDGFSAVWSGWLEPDQSGDFRFFVRSSDGARLYLDGSLIVDAWTGADRVERASDPIELVAGGMHRIVLEYYDNAGSAQIDLSWQPPTGPKAIVPVEVLTPDSTYSVGIVDGVTRGVDEFIWTLYPNPASTTVTIALHNPGAQEAEIEVIDILGRRVRRVARIQLSEAAHQIQVDVSDLASGTYIWRLKTDFDVYTQLVHVIR